MAIAANASGDAPEALSRNRKAHAAREAVQKQVMSLRGGAAHREGPQLAKNFKSADLLRGESSKAAHAEQHASRPSSPPAKGHKVILT